MIIVIALVGHRSDLLNKEQKDTKKEAKKFAKKINSLFRMTSAKNNSGITELFEAIAKKLLNLEIDENNDTSEYEFEEKSVLKLSKYLNY